MGYTRKLAIRNYIVEGFLILASLIVLLPLVILIFGSFKTSAEVLSFSLSLPDTWQFSNYVRVFEEGGLSRAFSQQYLDYWRILGHQYCGIFGSIVHSCSQRNESLRSNLYVFLHGTHCSNVDHYNDSGCTGLGLLRKHYKRYPDLCRFEYGVQCILVQWFYQNHSESTRRSCVSGRCKRVRRILSDRHAAHSAG